MKLINRSNQSIQKSFYPHLNTHHQSRVSFFSTDLNDQINETINFYNNSNVLRYAQMELTPFSLRQLIFFGKILNRHRSNPTDLDQSLVRGANFTRTQLPIRLARQIREFQSLPYIVTSNSYLTETYKTYVEAFEKMRSFPEIRSRQDNQNWCKFVQALLNQHKIVIPKLAIGVAESANHMTNSQIDQFMTRMLHSRISRRVLAEHHIALTHQFQDDDPMATSSKNTKCLGVIDTELEVGKVVERCIELAKIKLDSDHNPIPSDRLSIRIRGKKDAKLAYIPDHLEFIVFELLLNSIRATVNSATQRSAELSNLQIDIQIASSATHITVRISDNAGGILQSWVPSFLDNETFPPTVSRREMFSFVNLTSANDSLKQLIGSGDGMEGKVSEQVETPTLDPSDASSSSLKGFQEIQEARFRIGLPLSSIYAQFFGGSLEMYSIPGYSDIVLCLPKLAAASECP